MIKAIFIFILSCSILLDIQAQNIYEDSTFNDLQNAIANKEFVNKLSLRNESNLDSFPIELLELKNLRVLTITGSECNPEYYKDCKHITSIPKWISQFRNLEELYLPANMIRGIPTDLKYAKKLKILDLTANFRVDLSNIEGLKNLTHLYINDCNLKYLPTSICSLGNLRELGISHNNLDSTRILKIQDCMPLCEVGVGVQYPYE